ncbi:hypothetical protein NliqN6_0396 [Naganishia liquefaciens]|uniref:JmjC domain-containing protein n=1 Tax=Naganishia liquefaciens TaxID=104408 RepID=A0A8H3YC73_9TREE|nr:hypothetical protein NliqN6_0396 [Naganishia liquefaciens]
MAPATKPIMAAIQKHLQALLDDYRDLAPPTCQRLSNVPNALEMLRLVHAGRPVIFDGFVPTKSSTSSQLDWCDPVSLSQVTGDAKLSIAVTPHGLADALHKATNGTTYFVQPMTEKMTLDAFFARLADKESEEVYYLQSQNGNIYRHSYEGETGNETATPELSAFQQYTESEVPFLSEALGRKPDAVNLWIGDDKSVTSLHRGGYENIYHLLSGSKTFRLFPPVEGYLLDTLFYPAATYTRFGHGANSSLMIQPDSEPTYPIPWISVDPLNLPRDTPLRPIEVTVREGETLFLPAGWYHHVMQSTGSQGICVAVNYWYDQTIQANTYALDRYVWRSLGRVDLLGEVDDESDDDTVT